ncbi:unnamed protein product [Lymnaea stagnalis]|uniref:Uncharacterized protein n=1 Tax=Lymnaea stagnalis TaxID=6523 RepID=A0AAV2IF36_LYMST
MAIFPSTECGSKSYLTYTFTNIGSGPLMWEIASICPPYVVHANTTKDVYRVHYEVFKLHPLTGVLQPDETEKISIEFCPQSKGSFNQTWSIHDTAEDQVSCHKFNLYAKVAKPNPHEQLNADSDAIPQGLSKTLVPSPSHVKPSNQNSTSASLTPFTKISRQDAYTTQQSPVPRQGPSAYLSNQENKAMGGRGISLGQNSNTNAAAQRDSQPGRESGIQRTTAEWTEVQTHSELIKGSSVKEKGLHITDSNIKFPTLHIQDSAILKVYLQNQTKEIAEVVVEYEPNPPFLIKHHSFKVGVDKMVIFPVTFKPRHIGHFKDKVVFREIRSGKTLTALLDAQCEKKSL